MTVILQRTRDYFCAHCFAAPVQFKEGKNFCLLHMKYFKNNGEIIGSGDIEDYADGEGRIG